MSQDPLHQLFEHELKGLHAGETLGLAALQEMAAQAPDPDTRRTLEAHALETEEQIRRLEGVLESLGAAPGGRAPVFEGLVEERRLFRMREPEQGATDAFLVASTLKTERMEVTAYENVLEIARRLGVEDVAAPLRESLREEQAMLTRMQESLRSLNAGAASTRRPKTEMRRSTVGR